MLKVMYFTTTVGTEHQQIPFETAGSVKFFEVLNEIAKKLNLSSEGIAVAPPGGAALVYTDYQLTVDEVIKNYGPHFSIINRGIVGLGIQSQWITNPAERSILQFPDLIAQIGPGHPKWPQRVKLEIKNVSSYLNFLQQSGSQPWFFLKPSSDQRYNFKKWEGYLKIPSRPEIQFDMVILLTSEYPKVFPRAFADKDIVNYAGGNIYLNNTWEEKEKNKTFVMICHDHMKEQAAWDPHLSIAHFFIREIWYWWNAKQDTMIRLWDEKNS